MPGGRDHRGQGPSSATDAVDGARVDKLQIARHKPLGIHLWNEMWRREGLDQDADYPRNSIYEKLNRRYVATDAGL